VIVNRISRNNLTVTYGGIVNEKTFGVHVTNI
jgi:hypothetical protein